jgi:hypothetical protein
VSFEVFQTAGREFESKNDRNFRPPDLRTLLQSLTTAGQSCSHATPPDIASRRDKREKWRFGRPFPHPIKDRERRRGEKINSPEYQTEVRHLREFVFLLTKEDQVIVECRFTSPTTSALRVSHSLSGLIPPDLCGLVSYHIRLQDSCSLQSFSLSTQP